MPLSADRIQFLLMWKYKSWPFDHVNHKRGKRLFVLLEKRKVGTNQNCSLQNSDRRASLNQTELSFCCWTVPQSAAFPPFLLRGSALSAQAVSSSPGSTQQGSGPGEEMGFCAFWGAPQEGEELPRERRGAAADQQQAEQLSPRGHASMSPCPTPVPLSATSPLAGQAASSVLKAGRLQQSSAVGIMGRWQLWRGPRWVGNPLGRRRGPRDPAGMEQCSWMRSRVWCMEELPAPQSWHFTCPKPQLFLQATFV